MTTASPYTVICRMLCDDIATDDVPAYSDVAWQQFTALADAHGVAPLLYARLRDRDGRPAEMPASVWNRLQRDYYNTAATNTLRLRELGRLCDRLPAAGDTVPPLLLLKGASLAPTIYPDIALRPLHDVDMLVPRDALDRVVAAAQALGYSKYAPELGAGMDRIATHHVHLRGGPNAGLVFELHWTLIGGTNDRFTPALDWFWEQTENNGTGMLQLTPTAHLLYLAAHLMLQHGARDARLIWFYDLHLLLSNAGDRIDWDAMIARADEFHWAPALYASLTRTRTLLGTPLPEAHLARLQSVASRDTAGRRIVARQAVADQTTFMRILARLSAQSWRSRVRYVAGHFFPRPAYMRWRYRPEPAWLWPLCYPYRWACIVRDILRTMDRV